MARVPFKALPRAQQVAAILRMRGLLDELRGSAYGPVRKQYRAEAAPQYFAPNGTLTQWGRRADAKIRAKTKKFLGREFGLQDIVEGYVWKSPEGHHVGNITVGDSGTEQYIFIRGDIYAPGVDSLIPGAPAVGHFDRTINLSGQYVSHDSFSLEEAHRGKGLAARMLANSHTLYRKMGLRHVQLNAAAGAGASRTGADTWPVYGFDFQSWDHRRFYDEWTRAVAREIPMNHPDRSAVMRAVGALGANERMPRAWELAAFRHPNHPRLGRAALRNVALNYGMPKLVQDLTPGSQSMKVFRSTLTKLLRKHSAGK